MLHIIQSNRLEMLQTELEQFLNANPLSSPFKKEQIIVQSPGMSQWIKIGIAQRLGIVAQIEFPLPSSFIWRLYQGLLDDVPAESAFNKNNMAWKIFDILPKYLDEPIFSTLQSYINAEQTKSDKKLFMLCEKIADVYDQYLMYRPQWLETWQGGDDLLPDVDVKDMLWQPELWRRLVIHTCENLAQSSYHRANMHQQLMQALENKSEQELKSVLPERLTIFGISALPNAQLETFAALAERIDVYLYFFNPSEHYWGDIVDEKTLAKIEAKYSVKPNIQATQGDYFFVGNPLISSWGKLGRDYLEQLLLLDANWHDCFVDNFQTNLLSHIQSEIFQLAFKGESLSEDKQWFISDEGKLKIAENDTSIHFNDCHTPLREVEILHDYLLKLFSDNSALSPKDIIVMMPDVATYSPYIEAVFGMAKNERFIPYALADLAIDQEKPILNSFNQLMNLPFSRFGVSEILDLLQVSQIASKFAILDTDLDQIRYWLEQVGVKWGADAQHKTEFELTPLALNTWHHGLSKLLLGIVQNNETSPFDNLYATDLVEGMASQILGKLIQFFDLLIYYKNALTPDANLLDKTQIAKNLIDEFYDKNSDQNWDLMILDKLLNTLCDHYNNQDYQGKVSQKVLSYLVLQGLKEKGVGQRFLIGKVNFCTLMPMRSVPFKVVCMLGLNDADYPRNVQPMGFDLLPLSQRRKGDRSRKLDDRYLFLEALLSAREQLYMSYIGRSCFDNTPRNPSTLISELIEYISRSFYQENNLNFPQNLILQHHLQPFNQAYYAPESNVQSYNPVWMNKSFIAAEIQGPIKIHPEIDIELDTFVHTICQPQKRFYQSTLALKLPVVDEVKSDEEPFYMDNLARYFYLEEFLMAELSGQNPCADQILQRGNLPLANVGEITLKNIQSRVLNLAQRIKSHDITLNPDPIEVTVHIENMGFDQSVISGWLKNVSSSLHGSKQVFYRPASVKAKDFIKAWLYHLVAHINLMEFDTWILGLDEQYKLKKISSDEALGLFNNWFELYARSLTEPVPFFPVSAFEYVKTKDMSKAKQKFSGGQYIGRGESEDPYIRINFDSLSKVEHDFCELSELLITPLLHHLEPL